VQRDSCYNRRRYLPLMGSKRFSGVLVAIILAGVAFASGYASHAWTHPGLSDFRLVDEALGLLKIHYLRPLPDTLTRQRAMIRGMLQALDDPYTVYVAPAGHEIETDTLAGEYGGIGANVFLDTQGVVRLVPTPGGPADKAGLIEGDILLAVDGVPVEKFADLSEITASVRGLAGTSVVLTLGPRAAGEEAFDVEVVRQVIDLPSATGYLLPEDPTVGVIAVSLFSEKTPDEILREYRDLAARGATAFILDLRGNGGGLLDSAVAASRLFLDSGVVVVELRKDAPEERYAAQGTGELAGIPLAVLVDGGTASAAEVVAAALQQNGRAPLIGLPTFGKGSVQVILPLSDGSSLHVTSAEWHGPNDQSLDGTGLEPDIHVDASDAAGDASLTAARKWLRGQGGRD
jgi:carboxyl-terminal processing protease